MPNQLYCNCIGDFRVREGLVILWSFLVLGPGLYSDIMYFITWFADGIAYRY